MPQFYENVQKAMGVKIAESSKMSAAILLWDQMYRDEAPWLNSEVKSLSLPAGICSEMATAVTTEARAAIDQGSRMYDILSVSFNQVVFDMQDIVESICAGGSVVLKPYVSGKTVCVDYVRSGNVFPVRFNSARRLTAAIFPEFIQKGKTLYTRLEYHDYNENNGTYRIVNRAFKSERAAVQTNNVSNLGEEISLTSVSEWEDLEPDVILSGATMPLFVYLPSPIANNIDPDSPIGVSLYSRAKNQIMDADERWGSTLWEYKSKETAIQAARDFYKININTGEPVLPRGKERMYTVLGDATDRNGAPFFNVYSPEIRDTSFFNAFNKTLQRIEFNCRLSYGTLSDPQSVDKTATEIKTSKQRMYSTVKRFQENILRPGLQHLADAMAVIADLSELGHYDYVPVISDFDDSVVVDKTEERMADRDDVAAGIMQPWEYRMKYYRDTEERAKQMVNTDQGIIL